MYNPHFRYTLELVRIVDYRNKLIFLLMCVFKKLLIDGESLQAIEPVIIFGWRVNKLSSPLRGETILGSKDLHLV